MRAEQLGRFLEFRNDSNLHLRPLVSDDDHDGKHARPRHPSARRVSMCDVTACNVFRRQVFFCASNPPCLTEAEQMARHAYVAASTAAKPVSFEQADSDCCVSPAIVTGC
ncbi:BQ2448_2322 [Microbotryum intermedium]|uniref:BQ2448_2322 protein n=1 Tax=Microbotryum intermedium TaxID=269621 RepID=A0A238F5V0_9BASI|nr:BQ2448_2322 [Microbotryum intermedium]